MTNEEKAKHIADVIFEHSNETFYNMAVKSALQMARWKDEQAKETVNGVWLSAIMCQDHTISNKDHQYIDLDKLKNILEDFFHIKLEEE